MSDSATGYPPSIASINQVEAAPRRVRAYLNDALILDTTRARYVWEHPHFPQYYIPLADVAAEYLRPSGQVHPSRRGPVEAVGLEVGEVSRPHAGKRVTDDTVPGLADTVRFEWSALDSWFEEDEQIFVHPRNPYARVDAIRSSRVVRVELNGAVLAESRSPVLVFETGLPTRYYVPRTDVDYTHLTASDTQTSCPYKGNTSGYWTAAVGDVTVPDVAWVYDFPTAPLLPIAGLIAFYNEKVDTFLDGDLLDRPSTQFS
jgi:uncharacterized protein (DUF427 family)